MSLCENRIKKSKSNIYIAGQANELEYMSSSYYYNISFAFAFAFFALSIDFILISNKSNIVFYWFMADDKLCARIFR